MNGWRNRETWIVSLWFGDTWKTVDDVQGTRDFLEDLMSDLRSDIPDFLADLLAVNFILDEIDWEALGEGLGDE